MAKKLHDVSRPQPNSGGDSIIPADSDLKATPRRKRSTIRDDTKTIALPVSLGFHAIFRTLTAEIGCSGEDLMREALCDLFIKYGRGPFGASATLTALDDS
jgi:hypothetical protein